MYIPSPPCATQGVLLSRTEAQAMVAWSRGASRGFAAAPAAAAAAWLVQRGAAVELLLPEAEGAGDAGDGVAGVGWLVGGLGGGMVPVFRIGFLFF